MKNLMICAAVLAAFFPVAVLEGAYLASEYEFDQSFTPPAGKSLAAIQPDGRLIFIEPIEAPNGVIAWQLSRTDANGLPDSGFAPPSFAHYPRIIPQGDRGLLVHFQKSSAEGYRREVLRLGHNGAIDRTFILNQLEFEPMAVQKAGRIVGRVFEPNGDVGKLAVLTENGSPDPGFSSVQADWVTSVAVDGQDRILVAHNTISQSGTTLLRLLPTGGLDQEWDTGEALESAVGTILTLSVRADDSVVAGGSWELLCTSGNLLHFAQNGRLVSASKFGNCADDSDQVGAIASTKDGPTIFLGSSNDSSLVVRGFIENPAFDKETVNPSPEYNSLFWVGPQLDKFYLVGVLEGTSYSLRRLAPRRKTVEFSASSFEGTERGGWAKIAVRRNSPDGRAQVRYATRPGGTAQIGKDYLPASGLLAFKAGETEKSFFVRIIRDSRTESAETVKLILFHPSQSLTLGTQKSAQLTIRDR